MKLKKIVSLALAGVLAVSMLAGCNNGTANGGASSEAPAATGMVGKVIADLSKDVTDKVTFTAGSDLQKTLDTLMEKNGTVVANVTATNMVALNPALGKDGSQTATQLPVIETEADKTAPFTDKVTQTSVFVVSVTGTDEDMVAEQIAGKIAGVDVYDASNTKTIADLPAVGNHAKDDAYHYAFAYTGSVAVSSVKDSTTGLVTYVAAFSITRTPTKVDN